VNCLSELSPIHALRSSVQSSRESVPTCLQLTHHAQFRRQKYLTETEEVAKYSGATSSFASIE